MTIIFIFASLMGTVLAHTHATINAGRGPVDLLIPDSYRPKSPVPLIVSLHGFGGSGKHYIQYWEQNKRVDAHGFIVAAPTGNTDSKGLSFWNASDACCDKDLSGVDDAKYLKKLIETVREHYAIDPASIHVTGYSNGGFMAHRMACEHPDSVASIVSVAGASFSVPRKCDQGSVHVLQVHGVDDSIIRYEGGMLKNYVSSEPVRHPSAIQSVSFWAQHNGASPVTPAPAAMDLSDRTPGPDTSVLRFERASPHPVTVELWSIAGETHVPKLNDAFHKKSTEWMLTHRKVTTSSTH